MGKKIVYSTAVGQEYELAYGTVKIVLSPTMVGTLINAIKKAEELIKKLKSVKPEEAGNAENEIKTLLNEAFGTDLCTPAFGNESIFAVTSSGKFLFEEFFDAFAPVLEQDLKTLNINKRINKAPEIRPEVKKYIEPAMKPIAGLSQPYGSGIPDISGLTPEQKKALALQLLS